MKKTTVVSADILDKKIFTELGNGTNITEFICQYIDEKTYKSFRTFSKRLKGIVQKLYDDLIINEEDLKKINKSISKKVNEKEPELVLSLDDFLKDYILTFEITKTRTTYILNNLFLALPFLYCKNLKEILTIKYEEIEIHKYNNCIIIKYSPNLDEEQAINIKISNYYLEYIELYDFFKNNRESEYIFVNFPKTHIQLNSILAKYLSKYMKDPGQIYRFYSAIKNSLKYSNSSFLSNF